MLQVRNVSWRTGDRLILDKVSVDVPTGKMLGLVGPNGSGKSTLLRVIAGLRRASAGQVLIDGTDVRQLSRQAFARRVAFVAQHAGTTADLTVRHVVSLGRTPHRGLFTAWRQQDESALLQALDFIGMKDRQSERWKDLSGGEQQRVHIARALAQSPCEILLDEPTNHLDIAHQLKLLTLIQSLRLTCVVALHDLNLAAMFCDSLLVLHEGKAAACGAPAEVLTEPLLQRVFNVKARLDISPYHGKPHLHFLP